MNSFLKFFRRKDINPDAKLILELKARKLPKLNQWKFLGKVLTKKEKIILSLGVIMFLGALSGLLFINFKQTHPPKPKPGGELIEGAIGEPRLINPILAVTDIDQTLVSLIYSALLKYDEKGELVPDLAEKISTSENGLEYTVTLKKAFWQDGEPVTSEDILFTFSAIQNPDWKSYLWRSFQKIKVEALDEKTVKFTLEKPFVFFPHLLTTKILPAHLWKNVSPQNLTLAIWNIKPIGSGPWSFKAIEKTKDGSILAYHLVRNENYYGEKPWLAQLTFMFYNNQETALKALQQREIDALAFISLEDKDKVSKKQFVLYPISLAGYQMLFFNTQSEIFKNKKVRQAIDLLINQPNFTSSLPDSQNLKFLGDAGFDKEQAKKNLEEAGWIFKNDHWENKNKQILAFDLLLQNNPSSLKLGQLIKESLEEAKIKVNLEIQDTPEFKEKVKKRNYSALILPQALGFDNNLFSLFHSSQMNHPGLNFSLLNNRQIDILLEQIEETMDKNQRQESFQKLTELLENEKPLLILDGLNYFYAIHKKVQGVEFTRPLLSSSDRFFNLNHWFITKKIF